MKNRYKWDYRFQLIEWKWAGLSIDTKFFPPYFAILFFNIYIEVGIYKIFDANIFSHENRSPK